MAKLSNEANARQSKKRQNKYKAYTLKATCNTCKIVFSSPKKKAAHVKSGHKDMSGANKSRVVTSYISIFGK